MARSTLIFGSIEAALLASSRLQNQVVALEDAPDEPLAGPLLIISPSAEQVNGADPLLLLCCAWCAEVMHRQTCMVAVATAMMPSGGQHHLWPLQMAELSGLLAKWRGKDVVLVNAGWTTESAPSSHAAQARSFQVVYCFQPIAIQVMPGLSAVSHTHEYFLQLDWIP